MNEVWLRFISGPDVEALELTRQDILEAVEGALRAQGEGQVVLEPRVHRVPPNDGAGHLSEANLHAEPGQIVAGRRPGREGERERIRLWHRGLATTDLAVAHLALRRAASRGVGTMLRHR